jgi:hypothetical protein
MKTIKVFLIAAIVIIFTIKANATNWVMVTKESGVTCYVETDTIQKQKPKEWWLWWMPGDKIRLWVRCDYDLPNKFEHKDGIRGFSVTGSSMLNFMEYDCKERTYVILQQTIFDKVGSDGNEIFRTGLQKGQTIAVSPGSIEENIMDFVCKKSKQK